MSADPLDDAPEMVPFVTGEELEALAAEAAFRRLVPTERDEEERQGRQREAEHRARCRDLVERARLERPRR